MGHRSFFPAQGFHQRAKLALRVTHEDFVLGVIWMEHEEGDQFLHRKGFASAGNSQVKRGLVEQVRLIAHDEVMGDGVLPKVNAALVLNLLYLKGDEHRQTFGGESAERIDFPRPDGQGRVQPVKLLEFQHRKLAHVLSCHGKHRLGIAVKLLLGVGGDGQGNHRKHHALVAGGEVVQELLALLALQFHVIGHYCGKVVVSVLATLPVGDVGFHPSRRFSTSRTASSVGTGTTSMENIRLRLKSVSSVTILSLI